MRSSRLPIRSKLALAVLVLTSVVLTGVVVAIGLPRGGSFTDDENSRDSRAWRGDLDGIGSDSAYVVRSRVCPHSARCTSRPSPNATPHASQSRAQNEHTDHDRCAPLRLLPSPTGLRSAGLPRPQSRPRGRPSQLGSPDGIDEFHTYLGQQSDRTCDRSNQKPL